MVQEYNIDKDIAGNIRGMLLGTNVLLPIDEDPLCLANAISKVWHKNLDPEVVLAEAKKEMKCVVFLYMRGLCFQRNQFEGPSKNTVGDCDSKRWDYDHRRNVRHFFLGINLFASSLRR